MKECSPRISKCFLCEDKMIPKNAEIRANADRAALARMVARARPMPIQKRLPKNVPQSIEGRGNFLVQNPPKSIQVNYPTEASIQRNLGQRAVKVAQKGLMPPPGLDQRQMLMPQNRKP